MTKPVVYKIGSVLELKARLCGDSDIRSLLGQKLSEEPLDQLVDRFRELLTSAWIPREQLYDSLMHLAGSTFTEQALSENAWRLAANVKRLTACHAVPPWGRQELNEMVPVQIMSAATAFTRDRRLAAEFEFQILAGTPAGLSMTKKWPKRYCSMLSQRMGFSAPWGKHPFVHTHQFVNLRLYVLIEPRLCGELPDFENIWEDGGKLRALSCGNWNRYFLRMRVRDGSFKCCKGYSVTARPCHLCEVGQDSCPAAVHDLTFVRQYCDECKEVSWFDPAYPSRQVCANCYPKSLLKRG